MEPGPLEADHRVGERQSQASRVGAGELELVGATEDEDCRSYRCQRENGTEWDARSRPLRLLPAAAPAILAL